MAISRSQLVKELEPGLNALFGLEYKNYANEHTEIFDAEFSLLHWQLFLFSDLAIRSFPNSSPNFFGPFSICFQDASDPLAFIVGESILKHLSHQSIRKHIPGGAGAHIYFFLLIVDYSSGVESPLSYGR